MKHPKHKGQHYSAQVSKTTAGSEVKKTVQAGSGKTVTVRSRSRKSV